MSGKREREQGKRRARARKGGTKVGRGEDEYRLEVLIQLSGHFAHDIEAAVAQVLRRGDHRCRCWCLGRGQRLVFLRSDGAIGRVVGGLIAVKV